MSKRMEYKILETNRSDFEGEFILIEENEESKTVEIRPSQKYWGPYKLQVEEGETGDLLHAHHNSNPTHLGVGESFGAMRSEKRDRLQGYFVNFVGENSIPQTFWFIAQAKPVPE